MVLVLLRNTDARVLNLDIEIRIVHVQRYMDPALLLVVLDSIFNQIGYRKCQLRPVNLRDDRLVAFQADINLLLLGNRAQPLQNQVDQVVDIRIFNVDDRRLPVHFDQFQQIRDDFILPVDLMADVNHEILVHLVRDFPDLCLLDQRIREDLHGGHRRLQFMGDIGDKLLSGFLLLFQMMPHLVVCLCQHLCFRIVRHRQILRQKICPGVQVIGDLPERPDKDTRRIE